MHHLCNKMQYAICQRKECKRLLSIDIFQELSENLRPAAPLEANDFMFISIKVLLYPPPPTLKKGVGGLVTIALEAFSSVKFHLLWETSLRYR